MKVPPKRKGNVIVHFQHHGNVPASMKVPPKRKGNPLLVQGFHAQRPAGLNESPSEKEGKCNSCGGSCAHCGRPQ